MTDRLLRISDILGDKRKNIPALVPVHPATWYRWMEQGRAPKPIKFGRISCWQESAVRKLMEEGHGGQQ
jgi:predicted DNA-binding transcriptional regulator AlpA